MRRRTLLSNSGGIICDGNCYGSDDGVHDYVEIGGVKWATKNVGACTEYDCGWYFQWGDTAGYTRCQVGANTVAYAKPFFSEDYKFNNGTSTFTSSGCTKYNSSDGKTTLDLSDDAARLHWGGNWRMPTKDEFVALGDNTKFINYRGIEITSSDKRTTLNGVVGLYLQDKTDSSKRLFFPAAGGLYMGSVSGASSNGRYWSSSLRSSGFAYYLNFNSSNVNWQDSNTRLFGRPVRPVLGS